MKAVVLKLCDWIDEANEHVGRFTSWVSLALVLMIFIEVILRYTINVSYVFAQELEWHLFSFIFLVGGGYTLRHDGHVRVDVIYQRLGFKARAWVDLFGVLFFLIPGCLLVIVTATKFGYVSFMMKEGSPDPGGLPWRFLLKSTIAIGFFLMLVQGFSLGAHSLLRVLGLEAPTHEGEVR